MGLRACMFTNTPDEHFILDQHPQHRQVVLASPCSGHGYKFCSVVGEILADLATGDGRTRHEIGFLRLDRPGLAAGGRGGGCGAGRGARRVVPGQRSGCGDGPALTRPAQSPAVPGERAMHAVRLDA